MPATSSSNLKPPSAITSAVPSTKKAVQKLQREMQDEEDELGLGLDADDIAIDASLADLHVSGNDSGEAKKKPAHVSAGFSIPIFAAAAPAEGAGSKSKKQKKQDKKRRQMEEAAGLTLDEDGFVVQDLNRKAKPKAKKKPAPAAQDKATVHVIDDEDAIGADVTDEVGAGDEESAPPKSAPQQAQR